MQPSRWCVRCLKPMRVYRGVTGAGLCQSCDPSKRERRVQIETHDDPPDLIEAKYQAALKEVKRSHRLSSDLPWNSSLVRMVTL